MLPLVHAPAWIVASVLLVLAVLYVSLAPLSVPVELPTHFDKLEHAAAYVFLAVWFTGLVARPRYGRVAVALVAFGLTIEFLQAAMPFGRQGDPWDVLSNIIGIGIGVVMARRVTGGWAQKVEAWQSQN
ncbi:MAG TPA: VanZ family protein [Quisquiliibacterium sp.]|nr:VanZ family protein [Quisquiliibacterium sp.]